MLCIFPLAAAPPLNVQATQASASVPVEVSWNPPSGETATITGYRIFYGRVPHVLVPSYVTRILLDSLESGDKVVSIRSESLQLPSELVNAKITGELNNLVIQ